MEFLSPAWFSALAAIVVIDLVLAGDNAIVIALACRRLPEQQRNLGIFWGMVGAIVLRIVLIFFALQLLAIPFLKIVGGILLLWIGVKLLQPERAARHGEVEGSTRLLGAIRTVIIADAVMSLDNVVAVAAAAHGDIRLVVFGIVVSIPIIVWGSRLVLRLMDRWPVVVTLGGGLLGWIGGGMLVGDTALRPWLGETAGGLRHGAAAVGAVAVVALGSWLARRALRARPAVAVVASGTQEDRNGQ